MEILKKKKVTDTVRYRFSFIKCQNTFFSLNQTTKLYRNIKIQGLLHCPGNHLMKLSGSHKLCYGSYLTTSHYFKLGFKFSVNNRYTRLRAKIRYGKSGGRLNVFNKGYLFNWETACLLATLC